MEVAVNISAITLWDHLSVFVNKGLNLPMMDYNAMVKLISMCTYNSNVV